MVPPGRPRKGPHIHFQLRDDAQAELLRAAIQEDGLIQTDALCAAVDAWLDRRKRRQDDARRAAEKKGEGK